jgi:hypothetical protein
MEDKKIRIVIHNGNFHVDDLIARTYDFGVFYSMKELKRCDREQVVDMEITVMGDDTDLLVFHVASLLNYLPFHRSQG